MVARGSVAGASMTMAPAGGAPAVINPVPATALALAPDLLDVEALRAGVPDVYRAVQLLRVALGDEDGERLARPRVRVDVLGEAADVVVLGRARLVGHVEEGERRGEVLAQEGHPLVGLAPGALALVEILAGAVEAARDDAVADRLAGAFIAARGREVFARETRAGGARRLDRVGVNQLDAVAVREAVVRGVEVAPLIKLGLQRLVVDHRVHAVLVRQGEVEQLQLDGERLPAPVGRHLHAPLVDARGQVARRVDFDPDRLVPARGDLQGEAAPARLRVLGDELDGLPAQRCRRARQASRGARPSWRASSRSRSCS